MALLDLHEVEIFALIHNLATNVVKAIEAGAHAADPRAKLMFKNAAIRMHGLASALPDVAPPAAPEAAPEKPVEQPSAPSAPSAAAAPPAPLEPGLGV